MSSRADLLAAVHAQPALSDSWAEAVTRLGAWRKQVDALPPKQPARTTGRDQYEQFYTVTKSHVFEPDREALRREFNMSSGTKRGQMIEAAQREVRLRKQAEKAISLAV